MLKHATLVSAFAVLAWPAFGQDADAVVATVDGTDITLGEMILIRQQLPQEYAQFDDAVLFDGILNQIIQQQLLADAAGSEPARVTYALRNERRTMMAGELVNVLAVDAVSDDAIAEAYDALSTGMGTQVEWNAAHLLVETKEEAQAARARIVDENEDFAAVARDVSTGPSGPTGGDLGWFSAGQMVAPFEQAVSTMDIGAVSDPVQTDFGWHIITLVDQRTATPPDLEQLRPQLIEQLQQDAITGRIDALRALADITMPEDGAFDPALIGDLGLLEPK